MFEKFGKHAVAIPREPQKNLRWRMRKLRAVEKSGKVEEELERCREDPLYWVNGYCWTFDPRKQDETRVPMATWPVQDEALRVLFSAIADGQDVGIEKSRDMGASWCCVLTFLWHWLFREMQTFLMVSRVEGLVDDTGNPKSLFWKVDFLLRNMPGWMLPAEFNWRKNRRRLHIENPDNGTVIDGESTTGDVARGDRRTAILLDEFAAVPDGKRILASTRDATRCRIVNSTPKGAGNAHYEYMRLPGVEKVRLHWGSHPEKAKGLYTRQEGVYVPIDLEYWQKVDSREAKMAEMDRKILGRGVELPDGKLRSPWYAEQCERAATPIEVASELDIDYYGSGATFFVPDVIERYIKRYCRPPLLVGELEILPAEGRPLGFSQKPGGRLALWRVLNERFNPPSGYYRIGVDVSSGTGASNSCASVIDARTGEKVAEYVNPVIRPEAFGRFCVALARWFHDAYLIWEQGGPGRQFGDAVMETGYRTVYFRCHEAAVSGRMRDVPGWPSTRENKLALLGAYRNMIERETLLNRSEMALRECLEYEFTASGGVEHRGASSPSDPSGAAANHGDRVIADALAWKDVRVDRQREDEYSDRDPPEGSFAHRRLLKKREAEMDGSFWDAVAGVEAL